MLLAALFLAAGCAAMRSVPLDQSFWQQQGIRVGLALVAVPPAEVVIYSMEHDIPFGTGIYRFLQDPKFTEHPMRMHETRALYAASQRQQGEGFEHILDLFARGLEERGFRAVTMDMYIDLDALPRFEGGHDGVFACRDYREAAHAAGADVLIVAELRRHGTICRYADLNNYEVEVYAEVSAEMIDGATNRVLWRTGAYDGYFSRVVKADCSRPDHVPDILDGLNALLAEAARDLAGRFFAPAP